MGGRCCALLMGEMKNNVSLERRGVELLNNAQLNGCFANQLQERKVHNHQGSTRGFFVHMRSIFLDDDCRVAVSIK